MNQEAKIIVDFIETNDLVKIKDGLNKVRVFKIKNGTLGIEVGEAIPSKNESKFQDYVWRVVWWITEKDGEMTVLRGKHYKNQARNLIGDKAKVFGEMAQKLFDVENKVI